MAIVSICAGILGLLLGLLTKGGWMYLAIIVGLIGVIFGAKQIQAAQEEGESPALAYVGAAMSVAAMLISAIKNISASCG